MCRTRKTERENFRAVYGAATHYHLCAIDSPPAVAEGSDGLFNYRRRSKFGVAICYDAQRKTNKLIFHVRSGRDFKVASEFPSSIAIFSLLVIDSQKNVNVETTKSSWFWHNISQK